MLAEFLKVKTLEMDEKYEGNVEVSSDNLYFSSISLTTLLFLCIS